MSLTIATWNVNSINARLPRVIEWLQEAKPDVLLLQELKCETEKFPLSAFEDLEYKAAVHGQKSWNGVAILSKHPIEDVHKGLPGNDQDVQSRYIEARIKGVRIASLYLPNGNPVESEKYPYKLEWMQRLRQQTQSLLAKEEPFVLGGDYNIIPEDRDCYNPADWIHDALFLPESRRHYRALINLGLTDAFRAVNKDEGEYTYWDYQRGAWQRNNGIRIDHFLVSPQAADRIENCTIDRAPRGKEKASDHTPVLLKLST